MNKELLVSVILPTYNVERFLDKCMDSVVNQYYHNLEIIVVIDGATDRSYDIAKKWELKDERIKVVYQQNAGSGPARNYGLENANGDMVLFVDPDDWIDLNMISDLMEFYNKNPVDLIITTERIVNPDGVVTRYESNIDEKILMKAIDVRKHYLELLGKGLLGAPTKKLYLMKIIKENNVVFPDLRRSQDIVFNYRYISNINSLAVRNRAYYNYMVDDENYNIRLREDYYLTLSYIYIEIMELCSNWNVLPKGTSYEMVCSYFFHAVIANIEANIKRKDDIEDLINNSEIRKITHGCKKLRFDQKLVKFGIEHKMPIFIIASIRIKLLLKRFLKCITPLLMGI